MWSSVSGQTTKRGKDIYVDMVSQISFRTLGDAIVRRMGVGKQKGNKKEAREGEKEERMRKWEQGMSSQD